MHDSGILVNGLDAEELKNKQKHATKFGIAIFGVGRIGIVHLRNLCADPRAELLWLVDEEATFPRLRRLLSECRLEGRTTLTTPECRERVLADPRVSAILNCTPAPFHEALIQAALSAGKHVFTEKPIALSCEVGERLYRQAKAQNKVLFCAFNRRHDPQLRKLYQSVKQGEIGDLRMIKICSRDPPTHANPSYMKLSGGIFKDSMIHDLDMTYWLTNEVPESIVATGHAHDKTYKDVGDVDSAAVILKFRSGLLAMLDNSRSAVYGYDQRVEVLGTKGMLVSSNPRQSQLERWSPAGTLSEAPYFSCMDRYADSYLHEIKHFLDVLEGSAVCEDEGGQGAVLAVRLAQLCEDSMKTGQVISL